MYVGARNWRLPAWRSSTPNPQCQAREGSVAKLELKKKSLNLVRCSYIWTEIEKMSVHRPVTVLRQFFRSLCGSFFHCGVLSHFSGTFDTKHGEEWPKTYCTTYRRASCQGVKNCSKSISFQVSSGKKQKQSFGVAFTTR